MIPDAGHFVLNDDPEKVARVDQPTSSVPFATTLSDYRPCETRIASVEYKSAHAIGARDL